MNLDRKMELEALLLQKLENKTVDIIYSKTGKVISRKIKPGHSPPWKIIHTAPTPDGGKRELIEYPSLENMDKKEMVWRLSSSKQIDQAKLVIKKISNKK